MNTLPQDEAAAYFFRRIWARFPGVTCRYVDIEDPEAAWYGGILAAVQAGQLSLPVVVINGQVMTWGSVTSAELLRVVGALLGVPNATS